MKLDAKKQQFDCATCATGQVSGERLLGGLNMCVQCGSISSGCCGSAV
jgi:hypothetical protein